MKSAGLEALRQSGLRHVDCVVHIGAGTGSDVKDYVRLGVQKVILAEADPKSASALAALGDNAGCIEIVNGAVIAEGSKRATLFRIKDRDGAHAAEMSSTCQPSDAMFENGVFSAGDSEKVAAVAISTVLDRIPTQALAEQALLVLEVQGAELDLLQAAALQSRKSIGSIVVRTTGSQLYRGGATEQSIRTIRISLRLWLQDRVQQR